jgi:NADH-quinone oxidoreductase subunit J
MDFSSFLFWVFSILTVGSALAVVTVRNPVHAALYLVLAFFNTAGIWMLLQAEFLAITLVLVYVGAVMVLFLFVVMMLDVNLDELRKQFSQHLFTAAVVGAIVLLELILVISTRFSNIKWVHAPQTGPGINNTQVLGEKLYTQYVYPFELAAVLLLVAIVAAIALTLRKRKDTRYQDPSAAVRVKASDRLRMVNVVASKAAATVSAPAPATPAATAQPAANDAQTKPAPGVKP